VADGINARKIYSEENFMNVRENESEEAIREKNKKIIENGENSDSKDESVVEVDAEVDMSIVDRGSELLESILSNGRPVGTIEETWERIILAEKMRFRLDALCGGREALAVTRKEGVNRDSDIGKGSGKGRESDSDSVSGEITVKSDSVDSCTSKKYVAYVNQNFKVVKRLAAVVKV
jgi:hypothetical protein